MMILLFLAVALFPMFSAGEQLDPLQVGLIGSHVYPGYPHVIHSPPAIKSGCRKVSTGIFRTNFCENDEQALNLDLNLASARRWMENKIYMCCRVPHQDRTWAGAWKAAESEDIFYCAYETKELDMKPASYGCGTLLCSTMDKDEAPMKILGRCNKLERNEMEGEARPGFIRWRNGTRKEFWVKIY